MSTASYSTPPSISDPSPGGSDHLELRATEIARREGHSSVTDEDRESAYVELEETALSVHADAGASH